MERNKTGIFEIRDKFYFKGEPIQIVSGGIHYFRVVPEYWRDRLEKLVNMGCNTVETYVPWNFHEPVKGQFCFEGFADLGRFIRLAGALGLHVIVRPSPYICAEWEFGGLPAWLLAEDGMRLRCSYPPFLNHVEEYYKRLFQILAPLQATNGGSIIFMQLENEYGAYGDDKQYLEALRDSMVHHGLTVPLVTSDGPWNDDLTIGSFPGVLPTANFGSAAEKQFQVLEKVTNGPKLCMEFWIGWFDHWGNDRHMTSDLQQNKEDLAYFLKNDNVNIYMFEGGTNFGFMNGSNYYDKLTLDVTSYDYDAVLTEGGQVTEKYIAFQNIIKENRKTNELVLTTKIKTASYGTLKVKEKTGLFENLEHLCEPVTSVVPCCMEKLGQNYGYILYESELKNEQYFEKIRLFDANDRINVFLGHTPLLSLYDKELLEEHELEPVATEGRKCRLLVENMGRVNFGPRMEKQRKGIDGGVWLNGHFHYHWKQYPLPLEHLEYLDYSLKHVEGCPGFYRFEFEVDEACDTYLDFSGWGKGCAFVNGFNIGRFWEIGPQKRLYIPGPLLKQGRNEIILFETEGKAADMITLAAEPLLE